MGAIIDAGSAKIADLLIRLLELYRSGRLSEEHIELLVNLPKDVLDGLLLKAQSIKRTEKVIRQEPKLPPKKLGFLSLVMTHSVLESAGHYLVGDKFVVDISPSAYVKIDSLSPSFKKWFASVVEEGCAEHDISGRVLGESARNVQVINAFGGEDGLESSFSDVYSVLGMHNDEESESVPDFLPSIGAAIGFYCKDCTGTLRMVVARWKGAGWHLCAYDTVQPITFEPSTIIFTRKPLPATSAETLPLAEAA